MPVEPAPAQLRHGARVRLDPQRNEVAVKSRLTYVPDLVAFYPWMDGAVSLAADGSLWLWPNVDYKAALLKAPKQPQFLGNVFSKAD